MKHVVPSIVVLVVGLVIAEVASAQTMLPPGASPLIAPPPPPLPPPRIKVPNIPQIDARPSYNYQPVPRPSFSDRVVRCLDDAAAAGMGPADRGTYSRSCANH